MRFDDAFAEWKYRFFDLALIIISLPVVVPVLLILVALIKLDDPGAPVFFRQTRYGFRGKPFKIVKLRTMVPDAEARKAELAGLSVEVGPGFKIPNDPRITRIGRVLRKLYLDELPQLLNVVAGDMSIVGPRANSYPPETYEPWQRLRLLVKPGITGSWQIIANKPTDFTSRCELDIDYIGRKSLLLDASIIVKTALVCVGRRTGQ